MSQMEEMGVDLEKLSAEYSKMEDSANDLQKLSTMRYMKNNDY